MVLNECLDSFVFCQTEVRVHLGSVVVAVLSTLPEQTLVVAQEWSRLHLARVAEDSVTLRAKLLWRHWHSHLYEVELPFHPSTTVHPYAAVLQPLIPCSGVLEFIKSSEHSVKTYTVCTVRVSEVTSSEDLLWLNLLEESLHDIHISL